MDSTLTKDHSLRRCLEDLNSGHPSSIVLQIWNKVKNLSYEYWCNIPQVNQWIKDIEVSLDKQILHDKLSDIYERDKRNPFIPNLNPNLIRRPNNHLFQKYLSKHKDKSFQRYLKRYSVGHPLLNKHSRTLFSVFFRPTFKINWIVALHLVPYYAIHEAKKNYFAKSIIDRCTNQLNCIDKAKEYVRHRIHGHPFTHEFNTSCEEPHSYGIIPFGYQSTIDFSALASNSNNQSITCALIFSECPGNIFLDDLTDEAAIVNLLEDKVTCILRNLGLPSLDYDPHGYRSFLIPGGFNIEKVASFDKWLQNTNAAIVVENQNGGPIPNITTLYAELVSCKNNLLKSVSFTHDYLLEIKDRLAAFTIEFDKEKWQLVCEQVNAIFWPYREKKETNRFFGVLKDKLYDFRMIFSLLTTLALHIAQIQDALSLTDKLYEDHTKTSVARETEKHQKNLELLAALELDIRNISSEIDDLKKSNEQYSKQIKNDAAIRSNYYLLERKCEAVEGPLFKIWARELASSLRMLLNQEFYNQLQHNPTLNWRLRIDELKNDTQFENRAIAAGVGVDILDWTTMHKYVELSLEQESFQSLGNRAAHEARTSEIAEAICSQIMFTEASCQDNLHKLFNYKYISRRNASFTMEEARKSFVPEPETKT